MLKNNKKTDKFYPCECYTHVLGLHKLENESQVYIDKYQTPRSDITFFQRIKLALGYIINPKNYEIHGDIILSNKNARKLGEDLLEITNEIPNDMEFGSNEK